MAEPRDYAGATVLVCGAGTAGESAVRALLGRGARVQLADDRPGDAVQRLVAAGAVFVGSPSRPHDLAGVDEVITSPGWTRDHPVLVAAVARGLDVLGEVEFAWRLRGPDAAPWLAVTGTNGKTTTVRMLESVLRAQGLRALAVGNVGVSVIDAVLADPPYDVLAVELSSFQLHWSSTLAPAAGALLNVAPDHLDWHPSMADYLAAKVRVWTSAVAVGNADDPVVASELGRAPAPVRVSFTLVEPAIGQLGVRDGRLVDAAFGGGELLPAADVRPGGAHNVANALAAAALARAIDVPPAAIASGLRAFIPDPHRNQSLGEHAGVRYVDDSKATNPHAALASLRAYDPIVWIAGGLLKGVAVQDLVIEIAPRLAAVVLLGADRALLADALRRHAPDVPVIEVSSTDDGAMIEVVRAAASLARPGSTVLLAPAAASFDMFTGYAARGRAFAAAVGSVVAAAGPHEQ
jgi:UDP-N-acetylmuramoylalanine--D-glutamate ligase